MARGAKRGSQQLAQSAAANLEFVAILGIVLLAVVAFVGTGTGIVLMAVRQDRVPGAVLAASSLFGWPFVSLPCYIGLCVARAVRLQADAVPVS